MRICECFVKRCVVVECEKRRPPFRALGHFRSRAHVNGFYFTDSTASSVQSTKSPSTDLPVRSLKLFIICHIDF